MAIPDAIPVPEGGHVLVLLRHAKSDWTVDASDADRPLNKRGKRQAPEAGRWLARHLAVDLAIVSRAKRAQQTWALASREIPSHPPQRESSTLYTFDGAEVLRVVRSLPPEARCVALVGHNPAFEEAVDRLTGTYAEMPTSAIAVIGLDAWADAGTSPGRLLAHGRPPAG